MANVLFKRGLEANIKKYLSNYTSADKLTADDGCFYLTTDKHRLYVGQSDGRAYPVNQGVISVSTTNDLPQPATSAIPGSFYYIEDKNVLAIASGSGWVQVNTDTKLDSATASIAVVSNVATISNDVVDTGGNHAESSFKLAGATGLNVTVSGNETTGYTLTLTPDSYEIGATVTNNVATVTLDSTLQDDSSFTISGGTNVTIAGAKDALTISAIDTTLKASSGASFEGINNATGGFDFQIKDTSANQLEASIDPIIKVGNVDTEVHFVNGVADLPVYTIAEVNAKVEAAKRLVDGMTFKGGVGSTGTGSVATLPTSGVSIGDTYKVVEKGTYGSQSCRVGDLLIASGTEDTTTGFISGTINWTLVPSGNDDVYQYIGSKQTHGVVLTEKMNGTSGAEVMSFKVAAGSTNKIVLTDDNGDDNTARTVTIEHAPISVSTSTNNNITQDAYATTAAFPYVKAVTYDSTGHINGYQTGTITLKDTHNQLDDTNSKTTVEVSGNVATITDTIKTTDGGDVQLDYSIGSTGSITVTATGTAINMDIVWGTF